MTHDAKIADDAKLSALFALGDDIPDDGFSNRVLALAALEDRLARRRKALMMRVAGEAVGLAAVLTTFAILASLGPAEPVVPIASPAMIGLILLATWSAVGMRGSLRGS